MLINKKCYLKQTPKIVISGYAVRFAVIHSFKRLCKVFISGIAINICHIGL